MVDIRTHGEDHMRKTGCLREVRDDLTTFDTGIVVSINEQRLDDDQAFVDVRADEIVKFVQDMIDDLDELLDARVILNRKVD